MPGTELDFVVVVEDAPVAADDVAPFAGSALSLAAGLLVFAAVVFGVDVLVAEDEDDEDLGVDDFAFEAADDLVASDLSSFAAGFSVFFGSVGSAINRSRSQTSVGSFYKRFRMPWFCQ